MSIVERQKHVSCIGLDITNTSIRFLELEPRKEGLVPVRYGSVGIAYDVVHNGEILNQQSLIESFKRLRVKTQAQDLRFPAFENDNYNRLWSEVFAVAGFENAHALPYNEAYARYVLPTQESQLEQCFGVFTNPQTLRVITQSAGGVESHDHEYPLSAEAKDSLHTQVADTLLKRLPITGEFGQSSKNIVTDLDRGSIKSFTIDIWKRCFSTDDYIPAMQYEESFSFSTPIVMAYWGSVTGPWDSEVPSRVVLPKPSISDKKDLLRPTKTAATATVPAINATPEMKTDTSSQEEPRKGSLEERMNSNYRAEQVQTSTAPRVKSEDTPSIWSRDVDDMLYSWIRKKE